MTAIFQGQLSENMLLQQIKLVSNVIPHFCVILILYFISDNILMIPGHFQRQKVNLKGNIGEYVYFIILVM